LTSLTGGRGNRRGLRNLRCWQLVII
jgi:hypothetical protein